MENVLSTNRWNVHDSVGATNDDANVKNSEDYSNPNIEPKNMQTTREMRVSNYELEEKK